MTPPNCLERRANLTLPRSRANEETASRINPVDLAKQRLRVGLARTNGTVFLAHEILDRICRKVKGHLQVSCKSDADRYHVAPNGVCSSRAIEGHLDSDERFCRGFEIEDEGQMGFRSMSNASPL